MGLIRVQNVVKQLGVRIVLNDITLELHTGEIVGLIGANGAGKTTLFRLIAGETTPDQGMVTRSKGLEVGYLTQEPRIADAGTLHDYVGSVFAELIEMEHRLQALSEEIAEKHDAPEAADLMARYDKLTAEFTAAGGYTFEQRLGEILHGLGFTESDGKLPITALSGGQKCRAALARLLLTDSTFLLLDEPTNHLDIDAVRWLEKFLAGHHGGAVIISHDRYLLDRVAERIVEIDRGRVRSYKGNYSAYVKTKQTNELTEQRQFEKDQEFIAKERDFIARFLAGQRSKEAQGRRTRLERRIAAGEFVMEPPTQRRGIRMEFTGEVPQGRTLIEARDLAKRFDEKILFDGISLNLLGGQRVGITGPNGTGKSMLLKSLLGRVTPDAGKVTLDPKTRIGYYAQESGDLKPERTILDEIKAARPSMDEQAARTLLGAFLFGGDDVFKQLGQLSGGEQSRVRLICLMLTSPNVLVLDEPTNHLDIPSREALEEALADFPGTILTVSHDRYFLDRLAERLLVMREGQHRMYNGNYSFYIETAEREAAAESKARDEARERDRAAEAARSAHAAASAQAKKKKRNPTGPYAKLSLEQIESRIAECEQKSAELNARFSDPQTYKDPAAAGRLTADLQAVKIELAALEEAWIERAG